MLFDFFLVVEDFGEDKPEHTADKTGNGRDVVEDFRNGLLLFGNIVCWRIDPDPDAEQDCKDADEDADGFHNLIDLPQNYDNLSTRQKHPRRNGRGCGEEKLFLFISRNGTIHNFDGIESCVYLQALTSPAQWYD